MGKCVNVGVALCAGLLAGVGAAARAEVRPAILVRAERCLADRVERVVAAEPDIHAAASFLVEYACATEIAGASRYERNLILVEAGQAMSRSLKSPSAGKTFDFSATVDPESGNIIASPPVDGAASPMQSSLPYASKQAENLPGWAVPSQLRALAGDLVLKARERSREVRRDGLRP